MRLHHVSLHEQMLVYGTAEDGAPLGIVAILTYIGNFTSAFDLIYSIQGVLGPPDYSTDIMGTLMFRTFFGQQTQIGDIYMGATVACMMFFIILIGVTIYLVGVQRRLTRYEM